MQLTHGTVRPQSEVVSEEASLEGVIEGAGNAIVIISIRATAGRRTKCHGPHGQLDGLVIRGGNAASICREGIQISPLEFLLGGVNIGATATAITIVAIIITAGISGIKKGPALAKRTERGGRPIGRGDAGLHVTRHYLGKPHRPAGCTGAVLVGTVGAAINVRLEIKGVACQRAGWGGGEAAAQDTDGAKHVEDWRYRYSWAPRAGRRGATKAHRARGDLDGTTAPSPHI